MSTDETDAEEAGCIERVNARIPRRDFERVEERVDQDPDLSTRSGLIRESIRQFCLRRELAEREDVAIAVIDAGDDDLIERADRVLASGGGQA